MADTLASLNTCKSILLIGQTVLTVLLNDCLHKVAACRICNSRPAEATSIRSAAPGSGITECHRALPSSPQPLSLRQLQDLEKN